MNYTFLAAFSALFLLLSNWTQAALNNPVTPEPHFSNIAREFASTFPKQHLTHEELGDSISMLTWTNYIDSLDPDHTYFLESDIKDFEANKTLLDDNLKKGNLDFAYKTFNTYKERLQNRYDYITTLLLNNQFDLTIKESYTIKRKDLPFAQDMDAWNDIWRKKIKNEYVRSFVSKELENTNTVAKTESEQVEESISEDNKLEPGELILKRYKNMKTIIEDSDSDWILQQYLSAFAHAYDPHSSYLSPSSLANFNIDMKLSLEGIGALLQPEDGAAMIVRLIPGGPASKDESANCLKPGDKIIAVGQGSEPPVDILHWPLDKIVKLIRGPKGTVVVLTVIPKSDQASTKTVKLTRDEVKLEDQEAKWSTATVKDSNGIERKLGIITVPAFYANMYTHRINDPEYKSSAYDVEKLITSNQTENIEALLLDLRNNGGGALLEAINMTGLFISSGPIVQVKERFRRVLDDEDSRTVYSGPLVVLVNRLSASATEILASALQDYGRAVIVGDTKTHGKGTVQTILGLDSQNLLGAIKVTTAGYYRISGESTQLVGVEPDIVLSSMFDNKEWGEDNLPNALTLPPVNRANYSHLNYMDPIIARLREYSSARTQKDPQFLAYEQLLQKINTMYETNEMPLDLETRKNIALEEKRLYEIQEDLIKSSSAPADTNSNYQADTILRESLNILADLASIQKKTNRAPAAVPQKPPATLAERISNWLRSL